MSLWLFLSLVIDNKSLKDKVSDLKGDKEFLSNRIEDITSGKEFTSQYVASYGLLHSKNPACL